MPFAKHINVTAFLALILFFLMTEGGFKSEYNKNGQYFLSLSAPDILVYLVKEM